MFGHLIFLLGGIERVHLERNTGKMNVTEAPRNSVNFTGNTHFISVKYFGNFSCILLPLLSRAIYTCVKASVSYYHSAA